MSGVWVCNECGSHEYTGAMSKQDIEDWLACGNCGGWDFHWEEEVEDNDETRMG